MPRTPLPALIACTVLPLLAQQAGAANVNVVARSADGRPLPNVVVELAPAHAGSTSPPVSRAVVAQPRRPFAPCLTAVPRQSQVSGSAVRLDETLDFTPSKARRQRG